MGLDVPRLIVVAFLLSGMFVGFAAGVEILGVKGYVRADWNPAFGLWVVPLVFLARLHPIGVIPTSRAVARLHRRRLRGPERRLTSKFTLLLVGLTLIFMALTEWIARRAELGGSYLPGVAAPPPPREVNGMTGLLAATDAFSEQALTALVAGAILAGAPLMFAALGELVSQRAGVLNIGLEGMMLIGAYAGFVAAYHGGSEWYGFAAGIAGAGVSLLMVLFCVRWGLDQIVIGIGITLLCEGATALIFEAEFAESRPTLGAVDKVAIPGASELPSWAARASPTAASSRSRSSSTSVSGWPCSSPGCCGGRTWG